MALNRDQRRALRLLADAPNRAWEKSTKSVAPTHPRRARLGLIAKAL
jgi:hypothetical protein